MKYNFIKVLKISAALAVAMLLAGCGKNSPRLIFKSDGTEEVLVSPFKEEDSTSNEDSVNTEDGSASLKQNNGSSQYDGTSQGGDSAIQDTEPQTAAMIVVDVCGAVVNPGVYTLREGARVYDAIEMAGGLTAEADRNLLNQAELLSDAQKIRVYAVGEETDQTMASAGTAGNSVQTGAKVNINTADVQQLCTLSGIGESRAKDIIAYRTQNGGFSTEEEIMNVSGIKEATYNKIKEEITVG